MSTNVHRSWLPIFYVHVVCSSSNISRIFKLQKKVLRIINHASYREPSNPLFYNCNVLKVHDLYSLQLGSLMHQLNINKLPKSIHSLFMKNEEVHHYFTRQTKEFHYSYARTTFSKTTVKHEGPRLWKSIDMSLKNIARTSIFKRNIKTNY